MYLSPNRNVDFDRSDKADDLKNGWSELIKERLKGKDGVPGALRFPRALDPLKAKEDAVQDSIPWSGFPRALDSWYNIENKPEQRKQAHEAAEILDRSVLVLVGDPQDNSFATVPFNLASNFYLAPLRQGEDQPRKDDAFGLAEKGLKTNTWNGMRLKIVQEQ